MYWRRSHHDPNFSSLVLVALVDYALISGLREEWPRYQLGPVLSSRWELDFAITAVALLGSLLAIVLLLRDWWSRAPDED